MKWPCCRNRRWFFLLLHHVCQQKSNLYFRGEEKWEVMIKIHCDFLEKNALAGVWISIYFLQPFCSNWDLSFSSNDFKSSCSGRGAERRGWNVYFSSSFPLGFAFCYCYCDCKWQRIYCEGFSLLSPHDSWIKKSFLVDSAITRGSLVNLEIILRSRNELSDDSLRFSVKLSFPIWGEQSHQFSHHQFIIDNVSKSQ